MIQLMIFMLKWLGCGIRRPLWNSNLFVLQTQSLLNYTDKKHNWFNFNWPYNLILNMFADYCFINLHSQSWQWSFWTTCQKTNTALTSQEKKNLIQNKCLLLSLTILKSMLLKIKVLKIFANCNYCKQQWHWKHSCPIWPKGKGNRNVHADQQHTHWINRIAATLWLLKIGYSYHYNRCPEIRQFLKVKKNKAKRDEKGPVLKILKPKWLGVLMGRAGPSPARFGSSWGLRFQY